MSATHGVRQLEKKGITRSYPAKGTDSFLCICVDRSICISGQPDLPYESPTSYLTNQPTNYTGDISGRQSLRWPKDSSPFTRPECSLSYKSMITGLHLSHFNHIRKGQHYSVKNHSTITHTFMSRYSYGFFPLQWAGWLSRYSD